MEAKPRRSRRTKPTKTARALTARDVELLTFVGRAKAATTDAVAALFFGERSTASRRLARLAGAGLLRVHVPHLNDPNWYCLTERGVKALLAEGVDGDTLFPGRLPKSDALAHLRHLNDFRVALLLACRARPDVELSILLADHDLRRIAGLATPPYVPDVVVELQRAGMPPLALFVEIDLAQESAPFFASTKGAFTVASAREKAVLWGMRAWRPVVLASTGTRLRSLARAMAAAGAGDLWLGSTFEALGREGVFGPAFAKLSAVAAVPRDASLAFPLRLVTARPTP